MFAASRAAKSTPMTAACSARFVMEVGAQVVDFKRRSYAEVSRTFGPTIRRRFEQQQLKEPWWVD